MKALRYYLYKAYYEWLIDSDCTPYLLVDTSYVDVDVPSEFINNENKIVLNLSPHSIGQYLLDKESISFNTRFNGLLRDIYIPLGAMVALYSRENGDGIMFQEEDFYTEAEYIKRHQQKKADNVRSSKPKKHSKLKILK